MLPDLQILEIFVSTHHSTEHIFFVQICITDIYFILYKGSSSLTAHINKITQQSNMFM